MVFFDEFGFDLDQMVPYCYTFSWKRIVYEFEVWIVIRILGSKKNPVMKVALVWLVNCMEIFVVE